MVARVRQRGDRQWFVVAGPPLIKEDVVNEDVDVELMTFAVDNVGAANIEKTATLANPALFDTQELQVISVSVLDPAGCIMAKGGPVVQ